MEYSLLGGVLNGSRYAWLSLNGINCSQDNACMSEMHYWFGRNRQGFEGFLWNDTLMFSSMPWLLNLKAHRLLLELSMQPLCMRGSWFQGTTSVVQWASGLTMTIADFQSIALSDQIKNLLRCLLAEPKPTHQSSNYDGMWMCSQVTSVHSFVHVGLVATIWELVTTTYKNYLLGVCRNFWQKMFSRTGCCPWIASDHWLAKRQLAGLSQTRGAP